MVNSAEEMNLLGAAIGRSLRGGEVIELIGDVGAGKTTFTKGIASGLDINEDVQSPSFTLSREYTGRSDLELHHYDFYRLNEPGVMSYEIAESVAAPQVTTVVEWAESVKAVLPEERLRISFSYMADESVRLVQVDMPPTYQYLLQEVI